MAVPGRMRVFEPIGDELAGLLAVVGRVRLLAAQMGDLTHRRNRDDPLEREVHAVGDLAGEVIGLVLQAGVRQGGQEVVPPKLPRSVVGL